MNTEQLLTPPLTQPVAPVGKVTFKNKIFYNDGSREELETLTVPSISAGIMQFHIADKETVLINFTTVKKVITKAVEAGIIS